MLSTRPLQGLGVQRERWWPADEKPIFLLGYPGAHVTATLQHALLFHEIGHVLITESTTLQTSLTALVPDWVTGASTSEERHAALDDQQQLRRYLQELTADLVGARLGGDAFVVALFDVLSVVSLDAYDGKHPPPRIRMDTMHRLVGNDFGSIVRDYLDAWHVLALDGLSNWQADRTVSHLRTVETDVVAAVDAILPSRVDPALDLGPLLQRLQLDVPPDRWSFAEDAAPTALAEVLRAGLASFLQEANKDLTRTGALIANLRRTEELCGKAIELGEVATRWFEVRE